MRKAFYDSVMGKNVLQGDEKIIGPTHPRALSIQQRELVVRNGLGDREPAVRAVAASLLATWVDVADMDSENKRDSARDDKGGKGLERRVLAFLTLFDLAEGTVAADALPRVFQARVDIFDNIEFDGMQSLS
jgi:condensin complex subunit 3